MKEAIFNLNRDLFGQDAAKRETTLGIIIDPFGDHFCYCLEDVVRAFGIKRAGTTAIPATDGDFTYKLAVMQSPKYGKVVTVFTSIENIDGVDTPVLEYGGIRFTWIRCHGGNSAEDTHGCLLVNSYRETEDGKMAAWGSMKTAFADYVERLTNDGYSCKLRVTNLVPKL